MKANNLGLMVYGWGADWPDGYGFLAQIVDSRVDPRDRRQHEPRRQGPGGRRAARPGAGDDATPRRGEKIWVDIDKKVMDDAYVLPGVWAKGLLYRPPSLTNVFVTDGFQMYDYLGAGHDPEVGEGVTAARRPGGRGRAAAAASCSSTSSDA